MGVLLRVAVGLRATPCEVHFSFPSMVQRNAQEWACWQECRSSSPE